ncbi:PstS family phosphate ABC transporter substrate-binding protein [Pedobacter cryophilus]|uniref:Phosphate ABC transporter substrate-binding protein n=1 Tax=Pedobacter cryophilus TaxID=2571271 RepID=A0A4U1C6D8_9SPHI|nr:substrate-binding domain-containing protein [Pedobacter cryophilus]TKC01023.1 phosphate ABC transporter substrate-binding protein [Pedobacter cryophilus]
MKKNNVFSLLGFIAGSLALVFASCNQNAKVEEQGITNGKATILADESLFPIVDDEYQIFSNTYTRADISMVYKPQQEVINLFLSDSIDLAIMARELTKEEAKYYDNKKIILKVTKFAIDGIALITSQQNQDSVISVEEIKSELSGKSKNNRVFVFDNPKSSTVEYLMNLSGVKTFPKNFYALKANKDVIKYVIEHPNAIGIVSVAWIKRPTPDVISDVKSIRVMGISKDKGAYLKPSQSNLKLKTYPLIRYLYLINGQGRAGLGTGFASFLAGDIGQRIILKSGLAPDSLSSRQINIRN